MKKTTYLINNTEINRSKPIYIYYHSDIDGIACAVLLEILLTNKFQHKSEMIKLLPVDFDIKSTWSKVRLNQPTAVVDFLYHRDALLYFDHHGGSILDDFQDDFKTKLNYEYFKLEVGAPSAARVIFSYLDPWLQDQLGSQYNKIENMVTQADIIDNALFNDSSGWIKCEYDLAKLNLILQKNRYTLPKDESDQFCNRLVTELIKSDITKLMKEKKYQKLFIESKSWALEQFDRIKSILHSHNNVIFYDSAKYNVPFFRFYPYEVYPDAKFIVAIYKKSQILEVSVGRNPQRREKLEINIGELCHRFGGGGHQDVGGIQNNSYQEAYEKSREIMGILEQ